MALPGDCATYVWTTCYIAAVDRANSPISAPDRLFRKIFKKVLGEIDGKHHLHS